MPVTPTEAQSGASRRNGAAGNGPVTPEGKAASARNAVKHGLCGADLALTPEESAWSNALRAEYQDLWDITGAAEEEAVTTLVTCAVKQRRLTRLELQTLDAACADLDHTRSLATLARYAARLAREEREAHALLSELQQARYARAAATAEAAPVQPARRDTNEPDGPTPAAPSLPERDRPPANRHERRRLEALMRRAGLRAA